MYRVRATSDRATTTLSRPVCTVDTHFSSFFLSLSWLIWFLNRDTAASCTNCITTIVIRERERGYAVRLSSRSRYRRIVWLIDVVQRSNYLHIARNKTGWSSLNIHEDRSSYRRLSTSDYDITMLIFKNCFSTLNALLLIIFFFRVYVIEFWL